MPAQQRFRSDGQDAPRGPRQALAQQRQDEPVAGLPGRSLDLAPEDADFVAQRQQLDVPGPTVPAADERELDEQGEDGVVGRQELGASAAADAAR